MDERVRISLLLDFYGPLLTDKQYHSMLWHHEDDLSLGEIAEQLGVSRQAVHDNLQRAQTLLEQYEEKLHLVDQYEKREAVIAEIKHHLQGDTLSKEHVISLLAQMEG